jgi:hypothetical protein
MARNDVPRVSLARRSQPSACETRPAPVDLPAVSAVEKDEVEPRMLKAHAAAGRVTTAAGTTRVPAARGVADVANDAVPLPAPAVGAVAVAYIPPWPPPAHARSRKPLQVAVPEDQTPELPTAPWHWRPAELYVSAVAVACAARRRGRAWGTSSSKARGSHVCLWRVCEAR